MRQQARRASVFRRVMGLAYVARAGLLCASVGVCGCRDDSPIGRPRPKDLLIGFVGAGQTDPLWPVLRGGAQRLVRESGELSVAFEAPLVACPEEQIRVIRRLMSEGMKGLCVHVRDVEAVSGVLEELNGHGVRIITMGRDVAPELRVGFCGVDDYATGVALAQTTAALFRGGTIMVLHAGTKPAPHATRYIAFERQMRLGSGVQVLGSFDCRGDPAEATRIIRLQAKKFRHLNAWVAMDNWPLHILDDGPRLFPPSVKTQLIAVGPYPTLWRYMEDGTCAAMIAAEYDRIGYNALRFCRLALTEPVSVPGIYHAPIRVVRRDDHLVELRKFKRDWAAWTGQAPSAQ